MLGNETLWETARAVHEALSAAGLPHAALGGVAVALHGYRRNTVDVDLLIRSGDADAVRQSLEATGCQWIPEQAEFRSPAGVAVQFLYAGAKAGRDAEAKLPDPSDPATVTEREGLPVLTLARLIECKLACGQGDLRRTHKDFADVVELIAVNKLDGSFARHLHKSLREAYRELVRRVG